MGCDSYYIGDSFVHFSEMDDDVGCLCTFPHNDGDSLTPDRVRSLAYLGAAVVMMQHNEIYHGHLPLCLPKWIRHEIDRIVGAE